MWLTLFLAADHSLIYVFIYSSSCGLVLFNKDSLWASQSLELF